MTQLLWALVGALAFLLAYTYYTLAGTFYLPGGEAAIVLIEFGTVIGMLVLMAMVLGACLSTPVQSEASKRVRSDDPTP